MARPSGGALADRVYGWLFRGVLLPRGFSESGEDNAFSCFHLVILLKTLLVLAFALDRLPNTPVLKRFETDSWSPSAQRRLFKHAVVIRERLRDRGRYCAHSSYPERKGLDEYVAASGPVPPTLLCGAPDPAGGEVRAQTNRSRPMRGPCLPRNSFNSSERCCPDEREGEPFGPSGFVEPGKPQVWN